MNVKWYCKCGNSYVGHVDAKGAAVLYRQWQVDHSGLGHGPATAIEAAEARRKQARADHEGGNVVMWRLALVTCIALVVLAICIPRAHADEISTWVISVVTERAEAHDVAAAPLIALVLCESQADPTAVGDYGHSHGIAQLSDLSTGLLAHFHSVENGASAYSVWASADYIARVFSGEFADENVTLRRWSCWP